MPIINGKYVAPTWVNGQNPPIDAQEMQAICDSIAKNQTPTNHASPTTDYGVGNGSNYGHVKLSDTPDASRTAANGVAATPAMVAAVKTVADGAATTAAQAFTLASGKADATVTGTYQGSGTYGANNKNSINFTKIPTVIYISNKPYRSNSVALLVIVPRLKIGYSFSNAGSSPSAPNAAWNTLLEVSVSGTTVSWYSTRSEGSQGNNKGETYTYYAMY